MIEQRKQYVCDTITAEEVLLDAAAISQQSGLALSEFEKRPAVRWDLDSPPKLALTPRKDWGAHDQLLIRIGIEKGTGCELGVAVELNSRTEGIATNDSYWTIVPLGAGSRRNLHGAVDAVYPVENFLLNGRAKGWHDVAALRLSLHYGGPLWIREIVLQTRRQPTGPRLTDQGLFAALDLDRPGLQEVKRAVERSDFTAARTALRAHFQRRESPRHPFLQPPSGEVPIRAADEIRRNVIDGVSFPNGIDWRANPSGDSGWTHNTNRHYFMTALIHAYQATRDPKYAAKMDELFRTWIRANPVPLDNNGGSNPAWSTLCVGCRFKRTWLEAFFNLLGEPSFTNETFLDMLKSIYEQAEFLLVNSTLHATNWLAIEASALAQIGILFPEFKQSSTWTREGLERSSGEVVRQVFPDGTHHELSAGYHISSLMAFVKPFELARSNHIPVPPSYEERLRGMFHYGWKISRPDRTIPAHNDSGGYNRVELGYLRKGVELFGDETMRWFTTEGREGTPPAETSLALRNAGMFFLRSGWTPRDKYLFFDGGPFGAGHQHEDKLNVEVYANGTAFLIDPGIADYRPDHFFRYFRSTAAHNTVTIDGHGQQRGAKVPRAERTKDATPETFWATGRGIDIARAQYESGFENVADPIVHRRTVVFVKPDYWLVIDELDGSHRHRAEFYWHFTPMRVEADGPRVRSKRFATSNLEIAPLLEPPTGLRIACGELDPVQGWVAGNGSIPAPCAIYRFDVELPLRQIWALVPYESGTSAGLEAQRLPTHPGATALSLAFADGRRDLFAIRWIGDARTEFGGCVTDARLALVRAARDGSPALAALVEGAQLVVGSDSLIAHPSRRDLAEWLGDGKS